MDLATNPQYCHAIQFSVHDYTYPIVESEYQKIAGQFYTAGAKIGNAMSGSIPNITDTGTLSQMFNSGAGLLTNTIKNTSFGGVASAIGSELNSAWNSIKNFNPSVAGNQTINAVNSATNQAPADAKNFLTQYGPLAQSGSYRPSVNDKPLAYISLYMPDTLNTQITSNYDDVDMTKTFGILGYASNMISDALKSKSPLTSNPANLFSDDYLRGSIAGIAGKGNEQLGNILGNALKRVPNPQVQLIYRGLQLRQFQFDFVFTPSSSKEAEEIDEIIKTFTYYSLPDVTAGAGNQFFIPPQVFKIKFAFLGDNGISGQIFDIFKQNITNVFGNQFTKVLSGSNPTDDIANAAGKSAKIFNIGDCVLENVQVNYAPLGTWAAYQDGYPIQTTLSLTFREMNLINKTTPGIAPSDTSAYAASKNDSNLGFSAMPDVKKLFPGGAKTMSDVVGKNLPVGVP